MQSINARTDYGNSFRCAWLIYKQEGILSFWSGATPRLVRLLLSGGIVFTVYPCLQFIRAKSPGTRKWSTYLSGSIPMGDTSRNVLGWDLYRRFEGTYGWSPDSVGRLEAQYCGGVRGLSAEIIWYCWSVIQCAWCFIRDAASKRDLSLWQTNTEFQLVGQSLQLFQIETTSLNALKIESMARSTTSINTSSTGSKRYWYTGLPK